METFVFIVLLTAVIALAISATVSFIRKEWFRGIVLTALTALYAGGVLILPFSSTEVLIPIYVCEVRECDAGLYLPQYNETITDYRSVNLYHNDQPDSLVFTLERNLLDGVYVAKVAPRFH